MGRKIDQIIKLYQEGLSDRLVKIMAENQPVKGDEIRQNRKVLAEMVRVLYDADSSDLFTKTQLLELLAAIEDKSLPKSNLFLKRIKPKLVEIWMFNHFMPALQELLDEKLLNGNGE